MKKLCGWCCKTMPDVPGDPNTVTVGICDDCDRRVREEQGLPPPEEGDITTENTESTEICHREPEAEHRDVEIKKR